MGGGAALWDTLACPGWHTSKGCLVLVSLLQLPQGGDFGSHGSPRGEGGRHFGILWGALGASRAVGRVCTCVLGQCVGAVLTMQFTERVTFNVWGIAYICIFGTLCIEIL